MRNKFSVLSNKISGFTLIEMVVGMLLMSIGFVLMSTMLFPQADRAAENLHRMRAAELAQSVMNEIWSKYYDPNTNINGGVPACGSDDADEACANSFAPDPNTARDDYQFLDDYNGLNQNSLMLNSNQTYADVYTNFLLLVNVGLVDSSNPNEKLITITVTTPANEAIQFNAVRSNY